MASRVTAYLRQNVLGLVAIFLALSAGAYAVQKAPKNSVVSKSIKKAAVKSVDIGDGEVAAADLASGAVNWNAVQGVPADFVDGSDADSGGTVTSVGAGAGLTGGPITNAGTLALAPCPSGQLLKSNGSGYACAADDFANRVQISTATATPSVAGGVTLLVLSFSSGPTQITNLTDGVQGQRVTLFTIGSTVTIDDDNNVFSLASDWLPNVSDTLTLVRSGGSWIEVTRSAN